MGTSILLLLTLWNQDAPPSGDLIDQLLQRPAPAPPWESRLAVPPAGQAPGEDAPLEQLLAFWCSDRVNRPWAKEARPPAPSEMTVGRLLMACEADPDYLPSILPSLPGRAEVQDRVKAIYDTVKDARWREVVGGWLMHRGRHLKDELVAKARDAAFKDGWLHGEEELRALARLDWARAAPVLEAHKAGKEPRLATLALALEYGHGNTAAADALRAIVRDRAAPGFSRSFAFQALAEAEWEGRDAWFLSAMEDPTLRDFSDGGRGFSPFAHVVGKHPDRWIPIVTRLIGHRTRAVHDAAVSCLIQFHLTDARKDALKPLLPWLSDPDWSAANDRLRLTQSLDRVDLPESVPGLIWVVENSIEFEMAGAAEALAVYKDKRAVKALKIAMEGPSREFQKRSAVKALLGCQGLSDQEMAVALEAYAVQISTEKGREEVRETSDIIPKVALHPSVSLGLHLSYLEPHSGGAAKLLLDRADRLDRDKPAVAEQIRRVLEPWQLKEVDQYILRQVEKGTAHPDGVHALLERRDKMAPETKELLKGLESKEGRTRGIAAVLSGNVGPILEGNDLQAKRALLACARLVRHSLHVAKVGVLLEAPQSSLARAAEFYLESEDSPEARRLLWAKSGDKVRILGARMSFDPGHSSYEGLDKWEETLRSEMPKKDGPDELFALLSAGYWGDAGQVVIRVRGEKAELTVLQRKGETRTKEMSAEALKRFREFLSTQAVDDLPPLNQIVHDGMQYEYLHLTRQGGRRVFMNNPDVGASGGSIYDRLARLFLDLAAAKDGR